MIRYTLQCDQSHRFDSWFQNADAYASLAKAGQVSCPQCGSVRVEKTLMAPPATTGEKLSTPTPLEKLRAEIEAKSDYVGLSFAQEARDMHDGLVPERPIHGEANAKDAKKLIEDGVPVLPLPFVPRKKAH